MGLHYSVSEAKDVGQISFCLSLQLCAEPWCNWKLSTSLQSTVVYTTLVWSLQSAAVGRRVDYLCIHFSCQHWPSSSSWSSGLGSVHCCTVQDSAVRLRALQCSALKCNAVLTSWLESVVWGCWIKLYCLYGLYIGLLEREDIRVVYGVGWGIAPI